jgi:hypothetical protein
MADMNTDYEDPVQARFDAQEQRIRELEAESASLRADRDANIAAWERVLGKRSEGEAQTYIRELEAALRND